MRVWLVWRGKNLREVDKLLCICARRVDAKAVVDGEMENPAPGWVYTIQEREVRP